MRSLTVGAAMNSEGSQDYRYKKNDFDVGEDGVCYASSPKYQRIVEDDGSLPRYQRTRRDRSSKLSFESTHEVYNRTSRCSELEVDSDRDEILLLTPLDYSQDFTSAEVDTRNSDNDEVRVSTVVTERADGSRVAMMAQGCGDGHELQEYRYLEEDLVSENETTVEEERETDNEGGMDDLEGDHTSDVESFKDRSGERVCGDSEQDSTDGEEESENYNLLYEGCPIREDQSVVLISLFASRHHLSDVAIKDLLKLIDLHCPCPNNCTKSEFRYKRIRNNILSANFSQTKTFFCGTCGEETTSNMCCNENCSKYQKTSFKPCQLFTVPVARQIQTLISENCQNLCLDHGTSESTKLCDVFDGRRYKEIKYSVEGNLISLVVNADGAPIFKSSKVSAWPLMCLVSELPPAAKFNVDNMILAGIWCGRSKPIIKVFVKQFVNEIQTLASEGITVKLGNGERVSWKIRVLQLVADLPAKAQLLNQLQYNGTYGCSKCLHPGERIENTLVRVYPFARYPLRTKESVSEHAQEAETTGSPVYGVKGTSSFWEVVQIPDDVPVDYMHCVLEGVFKRLLSYWFSSEYHDKEFYLGRHRKNIDDKLMKICVPHDFGRKPRSLEDMKYFKATEYHNMMLYFILPVVRHFLPTDYFNHFALLVTAITMLLSQPTHSEVCLADMLLEYFVKEMQPLYGISAMTINAHSLCHLAKQVEDSGPLWSNSMFPFENMVKELGYLYSGTRNTGDQIVQKFHFRQQMARSHLSCDELVSDYAFQLRLRRNRSVRKNTVEVSSDVAFFLPMSTEPLQRDEQEAIFRYLGFHASSCATSTRAIIQHEVYHSSSYKRKGNICSSLVEIVNNIGTIYGEIVKFTFHNSCPLAIIKIMYAHKLNICKESGRPSQRFLRELSQECHLANFYLPVEELEELVVVKCSEITRKCIFIAAEDFYESVTGFLIPVVRDYRV